MAADEGGFTPEEAEAMLIHELRRNSLIAITQAQSHRGSEGMAWEATVSLAEAILPTAKPDFIDTYHKYLASGKATTRGLWRLCQAELRRSGRLGREGLPVSREEVGLV